MRQLHTFLSTVLLTSAALGLMAGPGVAQTRVVPAAPVNRQHEDWKKQADQAYRTGEFAKSIELTDRVLSANSNDHVALYLRGSAKVELGASQQNAELVREGISDAREAIRIVNRVRIDYYLPYLYGMSVLSAVENKPNHAETARDVAAKLLAMDRLPASEKANIAYQRGLLNIQLQDSAGAIADFEKAIELEPKHLAAHLTRCDLLLRNGQQPGEVEAAYTKIVETFPQEPLVYNNRGMFFQSFGRNEEARADFDRAIQINAKFVPAYTNRAFSKLQAGRFNEALADLNESIRIDPHQPAAYSLRGSALLQTGDAAAALADYQAALKVDPDQPQLRADVGFAQFFDRQFDAAVASFDSTLEVDPQARFLNPWKAAALLWGGRQTEAEETFAQVIAEPADQRDWFDMLTLLVLGKVTDNDVLGAISGGDEQQADAHRCEAFFFIGQRLQLTNQPEEAKQFYRQALESKSVHLSAYRGAQFALGEFQATRN